MIACLLSHLTSKGGKKNKGKKNVDERKFVYSCYVLVLQILARRMYAFICTFILKSQGIYVLSVKNLLKNIGGWVPE